MTSWNFSDEPSARPPEMMIFAEVSSGRSEADSALVREQTPTTPAADDDGQERLFGS